MLSCRVPHWINVNAFQKLLVKELNSSKVRGIAHAGLNSRDELRSNGSFSALSASSQDLAGQSESHRQFVAKVSFLLPSFCKCLASYSKKSRHFANAQCLLSAFQNLHESHRAPIQ
jgi:hypothetical protein